MDRTGRADIRIYSSYPNLVTRICTPKYMELRQWQLKVLSPPPRSMPKRLWHLLKNISLVSVVFKYFQNKNFKFTPLLQSYLLWRRRAKYEASVDSTRCMIEKPLEKKKLILSTTYDNKTYVFILSSSAESFDKGCDCKLIKRHFTTSIAQISKVSALQPPHINSLRSRNTILLLPAGPRTAKTSFTLFRLPRHPPPNCS